MKKMALLLLVILAITACYWRPPNPPVLHVTYAGDFTVEIGVNDDTPTLLHGNGELVVDSQDLFLGWIKSVNATVKKVTLFGPYVDLGTLSASLDGSTDAALLGDDTANVAWVKSWQ